MRFTGCSVVLLPKMMMMKKGHVLLERLEKKGVAKTASIKVKPGRKQGHAEFHFKSWEELSLTAAKVELATVTHAIEEWSSDKVAADAAEKERFFIEKRWQETGVATPAEFMNLWKYADEGLRPLLVEQVMRAQARVGKIKR